MGTSQPVSRRLHRIACLLIARILAGVLLVVMLTGGVAAGQFEDGRDAYFRRDYATALRLWRPLADQGVAFVQAMLGTMYGEGTGVPQDYAEAAKWYRLAAEQGQPEAQNNLANMYHAGKGIPQDYAEAAKWYRLSADQGNANAQFNFANMYFHGEGVPQDYVQAHMWLNLAASRYSAVDAKERDNAVHNRDVVASEMTPAQIAEAQRLAREWKPK